MKFTLFALALAASPLLAAEEGFVTLFDGKTLDGWKVSENPDSFVIEDGMLVAKGPRAHAFYMGEDGKGAFEDFELRLDVKTLENSNGGVFFHVAYQEKGWPIKQGYEVQVNNTQSDWRRTGGLYAVQDVKEAPAQDDQWFLLEVRVAGKHVTVKVDGKVTADYVEPDGVKRDKGLAARVLSRGTFALQCHDPGSEVRFKDIAVRPLPEAAK